MPGAVQVQMHIAQKKIPKFSAKWCGLQLLNVICWCISIVAAIGSIDGVIGEALPVWPILL